MWTTANEDLINPGPKERSPRPRRCQERPQRPQRPRLRFKVIWNDYQVPNGKLHVLKSSNNGIVARFSPSFKAEKKLGDLKSTFFRCPASGTMTARSPVTCLPQHTPHTSPAASPKNSNSALPPRHPTSGSTAINDACEIHHDDGADYANQVHRANEVRDTRQRLRQELWQRQDPRRLRQRMNCEQSGSQQSELMPKGDSSFW